jgi:hypothetical protein
MQTYTAGNSSTRSMMETTIVTKEDVEQAFVGKQKIQLIKLYRQKFNTSLKESKAAIETIIPAWYTFREEEWDHYTNANLQRMYDLFFPPNVNENAENRLYSAITKMKENWHDLGYKSFKDGVLAILSNF